MGLKTTYLVQERGILLIYHCRERYNEIVAEYQEFAQKLNVHDIEFIPVLALVRNNQVKRSDKMPWYQGLPLLQFLEHATISAGRNLVDFRFPVQPVIRPHQDFRGFSGQIVYGTIRVGEEVVALRSMHRSRVKSINSYKDGKTKAMERPVGIARSGCPCRQSHLESVESSVYPRWSSMGLCGTAPVMIEWPDGTHRYRLEESSCA